MIYGILSSDPEWGEGCITDLSNSLGEILYKITNFEYYIKGKKFIKDFTIVKSNKYNSYKEVKSDSHPYYSEIIHFLWNTKGWNPVDKSKVKQLCIKLNYNYENSKSTSI